MLAAQGAGEEEVDLDFFIDVEGEVAGIFHSPLDIRDGEGAGGVELVAADLYLHGDVDLVLGAEEGEGAVDFEGRVAGGVEGSGEVCGGKDDGFEVSGFEYFVGHAAVAASVAALAAGGVDDDGAAGGAGGGVEVYVSLLHVKCAVDGVEGGVQGEVDFAAGGVEGELVLRVERCGASGGDQKKRIAKVA